MLIEKVRNTVEKNRLLKKGDHIVLGLSGGPDSLCLFHILCTMAETMELHIHPVHVNHGLRPGDAERDQAFVEELCAKAKLPCRSFVVDCSAMAEERGLTSEEAGRIARYEAFCREAEEIGEELRKERGMDRQSGKENPEICIAVAQNANDQAETVLQRILRGTGTDGLTGMAYRRYEKEIPVIRPLLDVSREEIEEYCREKELKPVRDHTNELPIYRRNQIRLDLLPRLKEYNENVVDALCRMADNITADREYLWQRTEEVYDSLLIRDEKQEPGKTVIMDRGDLAGQPQAIRRRLIRKAFMEIGLAQDYTRERLMAAEEIIGKKQGPKTVEFPHGYRLHVRKGKVIFQRP